MTGVMRTALPPYPAANSKKIKLAWIELNQIALYNKGDIDLKLNVVSANKRVICTSKLLTLLV